MAWLTLHGNDKTTILLSDRMEVEGAGSGRPIIFCRKAKKAYEYLVAKGTAPDLPEGTVIEICKEP
jgi:hypothetical protein